MVQKLGYFWPWWREGCLWLTREHYWCWDFVRKYNECLWVNEYGIYGLKEAIYGPRELIYELKMNFFLN